MPKDPRIPPPLITDNGELGESYYHFSQPMPLPDMRPNDSSGDVEISCGIVLSDSSLYDALVEDNRKGEHAKDGRKSLDALARDMHETYCQQGRSTFLAMASERFGQMQSETLVGMLHHQGELVRWYACKGLEHLHKSESVGHLVEAAKDKSPLVRGAAIEALVSIGGEQTVPTFIKLLSRPQDFFDRRHTLEALGELRDPKAIPALWACYENADNTQVFKVAESLLMLGDTKIIPDLLYLVGKHTRFDPNQEFFSEKCDCSTAINLLGTYKVNAAVAGLIEALDCNYGPVREDAAWALGEIGDPTASRPLLAAMTRKRSLVADKAIEALGKIGDPEIIPDLVAIFETGTPAMARRASMALELMPEEAIRDHQHVISNIRAKREGESVSIAAPDLLRDLKAMVEALERTPDGHPPIGDHKSVVILFPRRRKALPRLKGDCQKVRNQEGWSNTGRDSLQIAQAKQTGGLSWPRCQPSRTSPRLTIPWLLRI